MISSKLYGSRATVGLPSESRTTVPSRLRRGRGSWTDSSTYLFSRTMRSIT